ncbi:MAG: tRNA uridine-5-carboxymethylaminomethyl(34) synthesis GTPase MnmE [Rhizobiales bacterium]|jgi:tRNA modification GTPase|nr:tRNA uridine-5-carboxymethylaminomethyl(34) synthesis GTPase MnmE [Hyphomicrobiales bacterium]
MKEENPNRDTIFALSSGRLPAAIGVVRISGPRARAALEALARRVPEPRRAGLARVRDPESGEPIDEALALWFPGPNSETGEDVAELQLHGGTAVVAAVLRVLGRMEGLRLAEPGEFTRRAFEAGHLDLTAVEGLADLVGAETEAQRRQAYRQLKGLLGSRAETWRKQVIEALALVEARIDFSDEADVPEDLVGPALATARSLRGEIAEALAGATRGERLREGLVVAIAGPPNAGKSTLLNRLARREAAIVSPIPGTTRDVIEVHLDIGGYPVTVLDTAGIRDSEDPVEQEGVRRARQRASEADLVLWVTEAVGGAGGVAPSATIGWPQQDHLVDHAQPSVVWTVRNKIDLLPHEPKEKNEDNIRNNESKSSNIVFDIAALTGEGLDSFFSCLGHHVAAYFGAEPALVSRERHRRALQAAQASLDRALAEGSGGREDIIAEELRGAANSLGRLLGRVDVEDVLDAIFRDFCIGK